MNKFLLILIALLYILPHGALAQKRFVKFTKKKRYWSVGGSANAVNYVGDLDPAQNFLSPALRYTRPNFGATITYRYSPRITYRGTLSWGRLRGDDKVSATGGDAMFRRMRNSDFRNAITELKLDVIYDFKKNMGDYTKRPQFIPYAFIGLAGFYHNPKGERNGRWIPLQPLQTEGRSYSKIQFAIPFGVGARWKLSKNLDLAFEIGWRKTFTGYLDDVNRTYRNPSSQNPLTLEMANKSVEWINQPPNPAQYAEFNTGSKAGNPVLQQFIRDGAPDTAKDRIYYNPETNRLEFWGWGNADDQRGHKRGSDDWYIITGFHLTYIIGGRVICPKFR